LVIGGRGGGDFAFGFPEIDVRVITATGLDHPVMVVGRDTIQESLDLGPAFHPFKVAIPQNVEARTDALDILDPAFWRFQSFPIKCLQNVEYNYLLMPG